MTRSGSDPRLGELARQLGLDFRGDCGSRLRKYALERVRKVTDALPVKSSRTLLEVVAGVLSLKIVSIREDVDVRLVGANFRNSWPNLEAQLRAEFRGADTLGLLLAHPAPQEGSHRFYAFIDARSERAYMAYFTAWHEVAHLLLQPTQLAFDGFRRLTLDRTSAKDPVEALVDQVAGELAFYAPLTGPKLEKELDEEGHLTLDGIRRIRDTVAPEGSFLAAAHALVRLARRSTAFIVAEPLLKPTEVRRIRSPQLSLIGAEGAPEPKLRAKTVFPNDLAKEAGLKIFQHMRVPESSVIADIHLGREVGALVREENQREWESGGVHLPPLRLRVEAAKFGPVVYGLVTCLPHAS
jgi:hypothetical protein